MTQVYRGGQLVGGGHPGRMTPLEVGAHEFSPRRRGVDADEVRQFQLALADELALLHQEARLLTRENDRLKRALRDWQIQCDQLREQALGFLRDPRR